MPRRPRPGPGLATSMDNWNGYPPARQRLFDGVAERGVENLVVLTGDAHCSLAADLRQHFDDPESRAIGVEFLGTSVPRAATAPTWTRVARSPGQQPAHAVLQRPPRLRRCNVTQDVWRSELRACHGEPARRGAPKIASFVSEAGVPGLQGDASCRRPRHAAPTAPRRPGRLAARQRTWWSPFQSQAFVDEDDALPVPFTDDVVCANVSTSWTAASLCCVSATSLMLVSVSHAWW